MNVSWNFIRKVIKKKGIDRIYVYTDEILLAVVGDNWGTYNSTDSDDYDNVRNDIRALYSVEDGIIERLSYISLTQYSECGSCLFLGNGEYSYHPKINCYDLLCWFDVSNNESDLVKKDPNLTKSCAHFERAAETKIMDTFHVVDLRFSYN